MDIFCVSCIPYVCEIVFVWLLFAFCFSFRFIFISFMMKAFLPIPLMMMLWSYFPEFYLILSIKKIMFSSYFTFFFYWHNSLIFLTPFAFRKTLFIDIYLHFIFFCFFNPIEALLLSVQFCSFLVQYAFCRRFSCFVYKIEWTLPQYISILDFIKCLCCVSAWNFQYYWFLLLLHAIWLNLN